MDILERIEGIACISLTTEDVVRHRLVKAIIKAYERLESRDRRRDELPEGSDQSPAEEEE